MPSIIIGLVAGVLCNYVGSWRARTTLDDSLDVFACHGAGGIWGTLATGLFASSLINSSGSNGLFFGNPGQLGIQALACVIVAAFAFAASYLLLRVINLFVPVRVRPAEEDAGLDISGFGEEAYVEEAGEPHSTGLKTDAWWIGVQPLRSSAEAIPAFAGRHHCSRRIAALRFFRSQRTRRRIPRVRFFRNQITSDVLFGLTWRAIGGRANRTPPSRSTASDAAP